MTGATDGYDAMLTGTYRLNSVMGDNPARVANNSTWTLPDRQAVRNYDRADRYSGANNTNRFLIPNGMPLVATLNRDISTKGIRDNDTFTMRVTSPAAYEGATLDGYVSGANRGGRVSGRSEITFNFTQIRLRNGETYKFGRVVDSVQTRNGESVSIDKEGAVRDADSRTNTTLEHAGIGTAIGALIGAIADGGKGAAIGAVVGVGASAGSVYPQGRDDLDLTRGTDFTIRASSPRG